MKQIKPEVIGYKLVYPSGGVGIITFHRDELPYATAHMLNSTGVKQRLRPVYKKEQSNE